jgi:hypothetical protein
VLRYAWKKEAAKKRKRENFDRKSKKRCRVFEGCGLL